MFAARLAQPVSSTVERSPTSAAGLPTAVLRQTLPGSGGTTRTGREGSAFKSKERVALRAWTYLWWSVRTHMADLHGLPRPPSPR